jgi:hypothetical protein
MSKRKKGKKDGSGVEEKDPKHPNNDPRTKRSQKQKEKIDKLALGNRKDSTPDDNPKDAKSRRKSKRELAQKAQKAEEELREQERRARQNEPVVEPGMRFRTMLLKPFLKGKIGLNPRSWIWLTRQIRT